MFSVRSCCEYEQFNGLANRFDRSFYALEEVFSKRGTQTEKIIPGIDIIQFERLSEYRVFLFAGRAVARNIGMINSRSFSFE